MICQQCGGYLLERVADLGGSTLVKCVECGKQQIGPAQTARGTRWRDGECEVLIQAAGEIE